MSVIGEQVNALRKSGEDWAGTVMGQILSEAADTIEELQTKLAAANMERSTAHYNGGWIPCNERLPEESGIYKVTMRMKATGEYFVCNKHYFAESNKGWDTSVTLDFADVIAWLPPLEPFKPKSTD